MAKVSVQSKRSIDQVAELVYQSKGTFVVVEDTGFSAYMVRQYGKPDSSLCKFTPCAIFASIDLALMLQLRFCPYIAQSLCIGHCIVSSLNICEFKAKKKL